MARDGVREQAARLAKTEISRNKNRCPPILIRESSEWVERHARICGRLRSTRPYLLDRGERVMYDHRIGGIIVVYTTIAVR